jgi:hypothetical protein
MGTVLALGHQLPFARRDSRNGSSRPSRTYPQAVRPLPLRDRSTAQPPPSLARRDLAIPGLHSKSPLSGSPIFTGRWALAAMPSPRLGCLTVTTPQPVTIPPAKSQPRAQAKEARLPAAPLRASVLWPRSRVLIEIDQHADYVVRRGRGILRMCNWSLASPARLLLEIEIEIGIWLTLAVNRSSKNAARCGGEPD